MEKRSLQLLMMNFASRNSNNNVQNDEQNISSQHCTDIISNVTVVFGD
jgi:hypothetical protein